MPIFSYFAVIGSVLVALLFVADATLEKSGPLPFNNESVGLPKPWHPEPKSSILTAMPAPEPDMTSAAVRAAAPPVAKVAEVPAQTVTAQAAAAQAEAVPAPKKPKRVARKQPRDWRDYAWSRNGNDGFFGGGNSMFGRF
jgi:hypothetical protein